MKLDTERTARVIIPEYFIPSTVEDKNFSIWHYTTTLAVGRPYVRVRQVSFDTSKHVYSPVVTEITVSHKTTAPETVIYAAVRNTVRASLAGKDVAEAGTIDIVFLGAAEVKRYGDS